MDNRANLDIQVMLSQYGSFHSKTYIGILTWISKWVPAQPPHFKESFLNEVSGDWDNHRLAGDTGLPSLGTHSPGAGVIYPGMVTLGLKFPQIWGILGLG